MNYAYTALQKFGNALEKWGFQPVSNQCESSLGNPSGGLE